MDAFVVQGGNLQDQVAVDRGIAAENRGFKGTY
jgi:hypothetical protein